MLGAYDWAFVKPIRKLFYNMTITLVSVVIAVLIGGIEALGLLKNQVHVSGPFWNFIGLLNNNFNNLGFLIIGIFVAAWLISVFIYRYRNYDRLEVRQAAAPASGNHYEASRRS
jgi:high-affinity nickel-transport protein